MQVCLLHQSQRPLLSLRLSGVHSGEGMAGVFSYESSEIDWCEDNYRHSEHVVESFNTVNWKLFIQETFAVALSAQQLQLKATLWTCDRFNVFPADEQLHFLHYLSHHALPSAPVCQREELGDPPGLGHDDFCRSVLSFFLYLNQLQPYVCKINPRNVLYLWNRLTQYRWNRYHKKCVIK